MGFKFEYERELRRSEEKKLASIERRLRKIDSEIKDLGFIAITHGGNIEIIEGQPFDKNGKRRYGCERLIISGLKSDWHTIDW
jgi:hypothetical protein